MLLFRYGFVGFCFLVGFPGGFLCLGCRLCFVIVWLWKAPEFLIVGYGEGFGVFPGVVVRGNSAPRNVTPLISCGFVCGIMVFNARLCG